MGYAVILLRSLTYIYLYNLHRSTPLDICHGACSRVRHTNVTRTSAMTLGREVDSARKSVNQASYHEAVKK